jgi:hypothetical protein
MLAQRVDGRAFDSAFNAAVRGIDAQLCAVALTTP